MRKNYLLDYRIIRTSKQLKGLKPSEILQTTNYTIFKPLFANRGKVNGFEEKRVLNLMKLIMDNTYYHEMSIVLINKDGVSIDGANRIEAHRRTKTPVLFRVLTNEIYNGSVRNSLNIVTVFNGFNPIWTAKQQFETAYQVGSKLAQLLSSIRADFVGQSIKLAEGDIRVNLMMTLVERNKKKTHSRKRGFLEFFNSDYLKYAQTDEFLNEFKFVCKVIEYFKDSPFDAARILKQLLFVMWDDNKFNSNKFFRNLVKRGFIVDVTESREKGKLIRAKIIELAGL